MADAKHFLDLESALNLLRQTNFLASEKLLREVLARSKFRKKLSGE
jgi:hypothetical protein